MIILRNIIKTGCMISLGFLLTACGALPEEKLEEAKTQYIELVEKHNEVIQSHGEVAWYEEEEELADLWELILSVQERNLLEMKEAEIDELIEDMVQANASYEKHQRELARIKEEEAAAVIVEISVSISNQTGKKIEELYLGEKDEKDLGGNLLADAGVFKTGETIVGLKIHKDVEATPWKITVGSEGILEELEIPVDSLDETGVQLELYYDEEKEQIMLRS